MSAKTTTVRFTKDDWKIIGDLKEMTGIESSSNILRLALRMCLVDLQNVKGSKR